MRQDRSKLDKIFWNYPFKTLFYVVGKLWPHLLWNSPVINGCSGLLTNGKSARMTLHNGRWSGWSIAATSGVKTRLPQQRVLSHTPRSIPPAALEALEVLAPRDLLSVALRFGNAFERGFQAAASSWRTSSATTMFSLYLMEDKATGEIRLRILWEWLHKGALLTEHDPETGARAGDISSTPRL